MCLMLHHFKSTIILLLVLAFQMDAVAKDKERTWTDPELAKKEDPDFSIQGEYGTTDGSLAYGVQVIAKGGGRFVAYALEGGLPGAGWTPDKSRILLNGRAKEDQANFHNGEAGMTATIENGRMLLKLPEGAEPIELPRIERKSPTLGAKPPADAVVLFDGSSADAWENGKMEDGLLQATGATSKQKFKSYKLHLEFRTPYMPDAKGQHRGNSGIYHSGRWETQILDSFGMVGKDNETGGIYQVSEPALNMCLPPLTWQTYDVEFTAAKFDSEGKRTAWPRITVRLNGVLVQEDVELPKNCTRAAPIKNGLSGPEGPIFIQNHRNPVVFRNIWVVPVE